MELTPQNIIISRTDSIGDVVLTLPVAAVLKKKFPHSKIGFMGKAYTRPVIEACKYVDEFIDVHDFLNVKENSFKKENADAIIHVLPVPGIAKRARRLKIPIRIGTANRIYHWTTCNKLVKLGRKNSSLHEAQLNLKLLRAFGINDEFSLGEIGNLFGLEKIIPLPVELMNQVDKAKYNLILHPKSQGSAREWGLENFIELIFSLDLGKYKIFISGTDKERKTIQPLFDAVSDRVTDITGEMNLGQLISFINECNGLVANSTGPLHIAAALGKDALGIYPPIRPMHPGRWAPLGKNAHAFVVDKICNDCKGNKKPCACIKKVNPQLIREAIETGFLKLSE